jgi:WD40 repeat protein
MHPVLQQTEAATLPAERVFISYARRDGFDDARALRERLQAAGIGVWQDLVALEGGRDWWSQVEDAINSAELHHFILVLTPGSLDSDIVKREVRQARQEGKTVLPVRGSGLASLSSLPRWMGHVYDLSMPHQFEALAQVLRLPSQQKRVPMMAPEPPPDYVHRPAEFDPLKSRLLDSKGDAVAITAALKGAGGYGKTTLAKKLAHDPDIQNAYLDGVLWVELGEKPQNLLSIVGDLVTRLTGKPPQLETLNAAASALAEALGERRILLVIDDVWHEKDLQPFLQGGPRSTRLVTTRIDATAPSNAFRQKVDALQGAAAVELLSAGLPPSESQDISAAFASLATRLGEWPLMLKLVNGFLRIRTGRMNEPLPGALHGAIKRLDAKGFAAFDPKDADERTRAVTRTIEISLEMLDRASRERFRELAVFPEDVDIPIELAWRYWSQDSEIDEFEAEDLLTYLENLSLILDIDLTRKTFRLHDTIRHILRAQAGSENLKEYNQRLIDVLDEQPRSPTLQVYRCNRMLEHLDAVGHVSSIGNLLFDPDWLTEKLALTSSPMLLVADFERYGTTRMHAYLGRTLRLCAGILLRDPRQLAAQLIGRLQNCPEPERDDLLSKLREATPPGSLISETSSLTPPGAETARLEGHRSWVSALAVLPEGKVVSGSYDRTLRVWDAATGLPARLFFNAYGGRIRAVAPLADGRVAFASDDAPIAIWDANLGEIINLPEGHAGNVLVLAVRPDGTLVSGGEDGALRIWDLHARTETGRIDGHEGWVTALAILPDGRVASGGGDKTIRITSTTGEQTLTLRGHNSWISALASLPAGRLASGSDDNTIRVWNTTSGREERLFRSEGGGVTALTELPGGRLVSGSEDQILRIWNAVSGETEARLEGHDGPLSALTTLPNGKLVSGSRDSTIRIWDPATADRIGVQRQDHVRVNALATLSDGRIVAGCEDRSIRIWDGESGDELGRLPGGSGNVIALVALPGERLISANDANTVHVWNLLSGGDPVRLERQRNWLSSLAVLPDGRLVAGNYDRTIRIWDSALDEQSETLVGHRDAVRALAVMQDGRLVSAGADNSIRLWDVASRSEIGRLEGHRRAVTTLAVLNHTLIASGGEDKTVRLWDSHTQEQIGCLEIDAPVSAVCRLADDRILAIDALGRRHWLGLK